MQVLDEIDLVHVAAADGGLDCLDRGCIGLVVPGARPFADRERAGRLPDLVDRVDTRGEERQSARLRGIRPGLPAKSAREPVPQEYVGHEAVAAAEEARLLEIRLEL